LGLAPLPLPVVLALAGITGLYQIVSETIKHFFYKREYALQKNP
jgi:hypothetical protein